jgi:hypothetical protein
METLFALCAAKPRAILIPRPARAGRQIPAYRVTETITRPIARKKQ